jgi:selenium metabolism protein YedF
VRYLDLKGKTCPIPVMETKKLVEGEEVHELEVIVDNGTSCENVARFLQSKNYAVNVETRENAYHISALALSPSPPSSVSADGAGTGREERPGPERVLVYVNGDTIGTGSEELGRILMRSFLNTLKEVEPRPWRIAFINSGVMLPVEGSEYIDLLKAIEGLGVEIISCGTCLDYYSLKDKARVGRISNMFEIVSSFLEATKVIKP